MTNQIIKQAQDKLERLDMEDQDSKGCTVTLAEWISKDNMELLNDFISQAITQAVEEALNSKEKWHCLYCNGKGECEGI